MALSNALGPAGSRHFHELKLGFGSGSALLGLVSGLTQTEAACWEVAGSRDAGVHLRLLATAEHQNSKQLKGENKKTTPVFSAYTT